MSIYFNVWSLWWTEWMSSGYGQGVTVTTPSCNNWWQIIANYINTWWTLVSYLICHGGRRAMPQYYSTLRIHNLYFIHQVCARFRRHEAFHFATVSRVASDGLTENSWARGKNQVSFFPPSLSRQFDHEVTSQFSPVSIYETSGVLQWKSLGN